jgi:hypothetical protein
MTFEKLGEETKEEWRISDREAVYIAFLHPTPQTLNFLLSSANRLDSHI